MTLLIVLIWKKERVHDIFPEAATVGVLSKKGVLKNFVNFTGKHLCWSLINKAKGLHAGNLIKKRLQHRCFLVNNAKFLRTPILKNICKPLLLYF